MNLDIAQAVSKRIGHCRPVLFLVGQEQCFRAQHAICSNLSTRAAASKAGILRSPNVRSCPTAPGSIVPSRQVPENHLRPFPLIESRVVSLSWHGLFSLPLLQASDPESADPSSDHLVQLREGYFQRHSRLVPSAQCFPHSGTQPGLAVVCVLPNSKNKAQTRQEEFHRVV